MEDGDQALPNEALIGPFLSENWAYGPKIADGPYSTPQLGLTRAVDQFLRFDIQRPRSRACNPRHTIPRIACCGSSTLAFLATPALFSPAALLARSRASGSRKIHVSTRNSCNFRYCPCVFRIFRVTEFFLFSWCCADLRSCEASGQWRWRL
jgi:hypothetical protein